MAATNLGRVQGTSIFISTAESSTSADISSLAIDSIRPLKDDGVLFGNGDIRRIVSISDETITCSEVISKVKGPVGSKGADGANGVGITSITPNGQDAAGGNIYKITLTNGETYNITTPGRDVAVFG